MWRRITAGALAAGSFGYWWFHGYLQGQFRAPINDPKSAAIKEVDADQWQKIVANALHEDWRRSTWDYPIVQGENEGGYTASLAKESEYALYRGLLKSQHKDINDMINDVQAAISFYTTNNSGYAVKPTALAEAAFKVNHETRVEIYSEGSRQMNPDDVLYMSQLAISRNQLQDLDSLYRGLDSRRTEMSLEQLRTARDQLGTLVKHGHSDYLGTFWLNMATEAAKQGNTDDRKKAEEIFRHVYCGPTAEDQSNCPPLPKATTTATSMPANPNGTDVITFTIN